MVLFEISLDVCVFRLGLKSFEKDVSGAVMDIQADEEEGMRQAKSLKKWYKKLSHFKPRSKALSLLSSLLKETSRPREAKRESLGTRLNQCKERFLMTSRQPYWCLEIRNSGHVVSLTKPVGVRLFSHVDTSYCSNTFSLLMLT